jgi:succinylglutamate desuccinylase
MKWGFGLLFLCSSVFSHNASLFSDSGIKGPSYKNIVEKLEKLNKNNSKITQIHTYGETIKKRPLTLFEISQSSTLKNRPTVLITGNIHGNEYLGIEDELPAKFIEDYSKKTSVAQFIKDGGVLFVIPVINPDGYEARERTNAKKVDLNRDFDTPTKKIKNFTQPETKALRDIVSTLVKNKNLKLEVVVDYHCCEGALLYPWSYTSTQISTNDLSRHLTIAKLAAKHLNVSYGTTGEILNYFPLGAAKDYYYDTYGALSFTYEGRFDEEHHYPKEHLEWWNEILSLYKKSPNHLLSLNFPINSVKF